MGNFYTNVSLRNATAVAAADAMRELNRDAFVVQCGNDAVVFDKETDDQDTEILAALAEHLAVNLNSTAFAVLNHDDDILWFQVYHGSELVAEYCNRGGPWTKVEALCGIWGANASRLSVWLALHRPYLFQVWRHEKLVRLLGLPIASVGSGYNYITRGELPYDTQTDQLIQVRRTG